MAGETVRVITDKENIVAIADAVRSKTGSTEEMTLDGIVSGINSIETGGNVIAPVYETWIFELENGTIIENDFTDVNAVTIYEGAVKKIIRKSDSMLLWEKGDIIYKLNTPLVCNGENYIDTGIRLFDTHKSFSIVCKFTCNNVNGTSTKWQTLYHCMKEETPYPGIVVDNNGSSVKVHRRLRLNTTQFNGNPEWLYQHKDNNISIVTVDSSSSKITARFNGKSEELQTYTYAAHDSTLVLGARKTISRTYDRFYELGTITDFIVYNRVLTAQEMADIG